MPASFNGWQMLGWILISGMLWLYYVESKDRHQPEPRRRLLTAFGLGIVACVISSLSYHGLDSLGVPDIQFNERRWTAVYCFGIIGPLEEGSKVLVAWLIAFRWREYDEPLDGFVYAAAVALGFACAENIHATSGATWPQQLAYTVALPITHALFSSIWGLGIGYAHFCVSGRIRRIAWQVGSILLAMFLHGLHDYFIFAYQAAFATSGLALALWAFVLWRVHLLRIRAVGPCPSPGTARCDDPKSRPGGPA